MMNGKCLRMGLDQDGFSKIWIQWFSGGLGNQIMEYIFFRYAKRRRPDVKWIFDDLFYCATGCDDFFEQIFSIKLRRVSQYYDQNTLEEVVRLYKKGIYLPQHLLNCGVPFVTVSNWKYGLSKVINIEKPQGYSPEIITLPYNYVYFNYHFKDKCWFMQDRDENLAELSFPPLPDDKNREYASQICGHMSVGIHVRRGDFAQLGWVFENNAYKKSCQLVLERFPDVWFFVFSNDVEWCKGHAGELGLNLAKHTVYVSGNEAPERNYIDMQLLSMCRGIIHLGLSTFSEVAAWLDQNLAFEVIIGDLHKYDARANSEVRMFERGREFH